MAAIPPIQSVPSLPSLDGLFDATPSKGADAGGGESFGAMITEQLGKVEQLEQEAGTQARALATGTTTDLAGTLLAVERADLALQLTTQLRNKAVEAYQEIMRMQV